MATDLNSGQTNPWYQFLGKIIKSRWLIGLILLGVVAGGIGIYQLIAPAKNGRNQMLTVAVEKQSLPITFSINGTVKPERTINLSPKSAGYLKRLLVEEGDRVSQGQIVAYMDDSNLEGQLIQARAQLAQAEANLQKLLNGTRQPEIAQSKAQLAEAEAKLQQLQAGNRSEDIAQAQARLSQSEAKLRQAEDDFIRNQSLFNQGAISQQTVNQKKADRDTAAAQVSEVQAALKLQKTGARPEEIAQAQSQVEQRRQALNLLQAGSRPEDIDVARAQVESARGALQTIQTQINDAIISAPFDGIVTKKYAVPGSFVTPTTAGSSVEGSASNSILTLASTNQVVGYLDEGKIARVKVGQSVKIKADAYPDHTFIGLISQIAAQATTVQNVTSFELKISLEKDGQQMLKAGMSVELKIQVGQINNAIFVPSAAIVRDKKGTGVYVMDEHNKPVFKPIKIGATIGVRTEVKSGLNGSEQVLISFPAGMEPKRELRVPFGNPDGRNGTR